MAYDRQIGTWHLADNPQIFEVQRNNNFEFVVTDIDGILRAGAIGTEKNSRFNNAQEMLRLSVTDAFVPHFQQQPVVIKRGNTEIKYAGVPTFSSGTLKFNDYIGADVKEILMAWQNMSCNIETEKVGSLDVTPYKKNCYLIEYTPDYRKIRTWRLYGCWISAIQEDPYTADNGDKHSVSCTIEYDRAQVDLSEVV